MESSDRRSSLKSNNGVSALLSLSACRSRDGQFVGKYHQTKVSVSTNSSKRSKCVFLSSCLQIVYPKCDVYDKCAYSSSFRKLAFLGDLCSVNVLLYIFYVHFELKIQS